MVTKDGSSAPAGTLVCQLTNALVHLPVLLVFSGSGVTFSGPHVADWPLWLFTGLQGVFYLRSMQILPLRLGYSTTFALSLWGQLATAAFLDFRKMGAVAISASRMLSLALVILGAAVSASSSKAKAGEPQKDAAK